MNWKKIGLGFVAAVGAIASGGMVSGLIFAPTVGTDQGLAAGAIVVGYMLIGAVIALLLTLYLAWRLSTAALGWLTLGLIMSSALLIGFLYWRQQGTAATSSTTPATSNSRLTTQSTAVRSTTEPAKDFPPASSVSGSDSEESMLEDLGFALVPYGTTGIQLHFYADPTPESPPTDSLVYTQQGGRYLLVYAPPYLLPFYQKEDYQRLYFRLTGVATDRVEIELNEPLERRAWVDRDAVQVLFWPDFLVHVFSVTPLDPENFPLRERPLDHAAPLSVDLTTVFLLPQRVSGDWIEVRISSDGRPEGRAAWLRWRKGERRLVGWDYQL